MHKKTILQAKEDLLKKKYSAVELTEAVYQRIDKVEPKVQAYVHLTRNIANEQAQEADQKMAVGQDAPLLGIPIALKEAIKKKQLKNNYNIMLIGFGVGLSWGSTIIKWNDIK